MASDSCGNMCPRMQRYSPEIPWVLLQQDVRSGQHEAQYDVACQVCGAAETIPFHNLSGFAQAHRVHRAPDGSLHLGDAVAAVAKPVARAFGMDPNCTPCEARRRMLNSLRRPW